MPASDDRHISEEPGLRTVRGFSPRTLRNARRAAGLSQAELAVAAGIAASTIAGWERGVTHPTGTRLQQVADALGLQLADLAYLAPERMTLADIRTSRGFTVAAVAASAGLNIGTISRVERGARPAEATVDALAAAYGLSEQEIRSAWERGLVQARNAAKPSQ